jgi:hypothetical protein
VKAENLAWRDIAIFSDGSGKAGDQYDSALGVIERWESVMKLQRVFIAKHHLTLAGLSWSVAYLEPAIEINPFRYRGQKTTARDIIKLWPGLAWKRVKSKWTVEESYNWEAILDGVTIRLEKAETIKPQPSLSEGLINLEEEGAA